MRDNDHERILQLMRRMGFANAVKVKESRMFFGLLRAAYYHASV
jgi:hypothetical protein